MPAKKAKKRTTKPVVKVEAPEIKQAEELATTHVKDTDFKKLEEDYKALSTSYETLQKEHEAKKLSNKEEINKLTNLKTVTAQELKNLKAEVDNAKNYLENSQLSIKNAVEAGNAQIRDIHHDYQRVEELLKVKKDELIQLAPELDNKYKERAVLETRIKELGEQYSKENERYQTVLVGLQSKIKEEYLKYQDIVKRSAKIIEALKDKEREIEDLKAELLTKLSH
jgi:chromosome segregation ATPase